MHDQVLEPRGQDLLKSFFQAFREHIATQFDGGTQEGIINTVHHLGDDITAELTAQFADTATQILKSGFRCTHQCGVSSRLILIVSKVQHLLVRITGSGCTHHRCTHSSTGTGNKEVHNRGCHDGGSHVRSCGDSIVGNLANRIAKDLEPIISQILSYHAGSHLGSGLGNVVILSVENVFDAGLELIHTGFDTEEQLKAGLTLQFAVSVRSLLVVQSLTDRIEVLVRSLLAFLCIVVVVDGNLVFGHVVIDEEIIGIRIIGYGLVDNFLSHTVFCTVDVLIGNIIVTHAEITGQIVPPSIALGADISAVFLEVRIVDHTGEGDAFLNMSGLIQILLLLCNLSINCFQPAVLLDGSLEVVFGESNARQNILDPLSFLLQLCDLLLASLQVELALLLIVLLIGHVCIIVSLGFPLGEILLSIKESIVDVSVGSAEVVQIGQYRIVCFIVINGLVFLQVGTDFLTSGGEVRSPVRKNFSVVCGVNAAPGRIFQHGIVTLYISLGILYEGVDVIVVHQRRRIRPRFRLNSKSTPGILVEHSCPGRSPSVVCDGLLVSGRRLTSFLLLVLFLVFAQQFVSYRPHAYTS